MADVFISYCREDRQLAERLAGALEREPLSVWWDREIVGGDEFDQVIERELEVARSVLVLWSRAGVKSDWVRNEASLAAERRVLVPLRVEPVKLPLEFRHTQTLDFTAWNGEADAEEFVALRRAVAARLRQSLPGAASDDARAAQRPVDRRPPALGALIGVTRTFFDNTLRAAGAAAAVAAVLVAAFLGWRAYRAAVERQVHAAVGAADLVEVSATTPDPPHPTSRVEPAPEAEMSPANVVPAIVPASVGGTPTTPVPAAAVEAGVDFIANGGFERAGSGGEPADWEPERWVAGGELRLDSLYRRSGSSAVRLSAETPNHLRWIQVVELRPHTHYVLSGWGMTQDVAHSAEADDRGASLAVRWTGESGLRVFVSAGLRGQSFGWQPLRLHFDTEEASLVTVMLQLGSYGGTTSGVAWFDDVTLRIVGEEQGR